MARGCFCRVQVLLLVLAVSLRGQDSVRQWGEACGRGLIPTEARAQFSTNSQQAFRSTYCGDWYRLHQQEVEGSGGAKILVVQIGGEGSSRTVEVTHDQFCADQNLQAASATFWEVWSRAVPQEMSRGFFHCVEQAAYQGGNPAAVVLTPVSDSNQVLIANLFWNRNITTDQPKFDSIESLNLTCSQPYRKGEKITVTPKAISCTWKGVASEGSLVVHTERHGSAARTFDRQFVRLGTVDVTLWHREDVKVNTIKTLGTLVETVEAHDQKCIRSFDGLFGDVWRQIRDQLRGKYGQELDAACFDNQWAGWEYPFSITASQPGGRLKEPWGVECVVDNLNSCAWNANHPIALLQSGPQAVRFKKAFGSRTIKVRAWATEDVYEPKPISRAGGTWELRFDGQTFVVRVPTGESANLLISWSDGTSTESIAAGEETTRLKLVRRSDSSPANPPPFLDYTYRVELPQSGPVLNQLLRFNTSKVSQ